MTCGAPFHATEFVCCYDPQQPGPCEYDPQQPGPCEYDPDIDAYLADVLAKGPDHPEHPEQR